MSRSLTVSRRVSAMISDSASSTTLRVLENGALKTATPRSAAVARSIWLVPMQKAPMASRSGRALEHRGAVTVVLERTPSSVHALQPLDELVLAERAVEPLDVPAGVLEVPGRVGVDVLEQEGALGGGHGAPGVRR